MSDNRPDAPDLTVPDAVDLWIRRKKPDWKGQTARTYRRNLQTFEEYAVAEGIETVSDFTRWNLGGYTDHLLGKDYARVTVAGRQKTARTWIKYLESQGLVPLGFHLAIQTIQLDDKEETSDAQLAPEDARTLLSFYRGDARWRGTVRHALLEVVWHVGPRMSGVIALDLDDYDPEAGVLKFRNRPETDTRLKKGNRHERNVALSEVPCDILDLYIARERNQKRDEHGRKPLFATQQGRATRSTVRGWMYQATQPCMAVECPHGNRRPSCDFVPRSKASRCPSTRSPHPVRRGSITWQRNLGFDAETVAQRVASTPQVIRRYYDKPEYGDELERRRKDTENIDIEAHLHPTDLGTEVSDD